MMYLIFLGPNMASKRKSESDKGGYRRKRHTLDFEVKMSVVAGGHCIYIRYFWLTVWLLKWNPVVSWGAFVYTWKVHWDNHCTATHSCKHYETYFEVVTVLSVHLEHDWFLIWLWLSLKLQYPQLLIRGQANSKLCDINKYAFQRLM